MAYSKTRDTREGERRFDAALELFKQIKDTALATDVAMLYHEYGGHGDASFDVCADAMFRAIHEIIPPEPPEDEYEQAMKAQAIWENL